MKLLRAIIALGFISPSAAYSATTTSIGGAVTINIVGTFKNPLNNNGNQGTVAGDVKCAALVALVPSNLNSTIGSLSISTILNHLGEESATAVGTVSSNGAAFTCAPTVNYHYENIDTANFQIVIS